MKWSEVRLTFSQADHPGCIRHPGRYPIVVEPTVQNIRLGRVFIDRESSINLLFVDALGTLQIPRSLLRPSPPFFGITPGSSAKPQGKSSCPLPSARGTTSEPKGRPSMAQFMAISHYTYQAIKIPGPAGVITIVGNTKMAKHCDKRSLDMDELTPGSQPVTCDPIGRPIKVHVIASPDDRLKAVSLDDTDPTKTVQIRVALDPK
ncbi:uncharacterized protein LOC133884194 [Phragmites australis]|uniref:uncharacterized protein LOC133884194 n=1 Tax=Phragmites australis TaxID=29695 RepID=UPI002D78A260|nr:uncharacterized protein LOC133884194 [Phragmites australis]